MKNKKNIVIGLIIAGIIVFGVIQFISIKEKNYDQAKSIITTQKADTNDLDKILKYKNKYIGDAPNVTNLFNNLLLNNIKMDFKIFSDKFELEVNYKDNAQNIGEEMVKHALIYNSTAAFALIENLKVIDYNFIGSSYQLKREDIESLYPNFSNILENENWSKYVQSKMEDNQYLTESFQKVIKEK